MELTEIDYFWKRLELKCPDTASAVTATITVTQPQGYVQQLTAAEIRVGNGRAQLTILYPLIDEGRYDTNSLGAGYVHCFWVMGAYTFEVVLFDGGEKLAVETLVLEADSFFPRHEKPSPADPGLVERVMTVNARPQIIECASRRSVYLNEDNASYTIAIHKQRVSRCSVEVDVTARHGSQTLAGPWRFELTDTAQQGGFSTADWDSGEYWIRIRMLDNGVPVGPYCVRKFLRVIDPPPPPPPVLELAGHPEVLVDGYSFDVVDGVQFVPDQLRKSGPVVSQTAAHENQCLGVSSITWNDEQQQFEAVYVNQYDLRERKATASQRVGLSMLAVSKDGDHWQKPDLGLIDYDGSADNNILSAQPNSSIVDAEHQHDIEHAQFRFYDADRDGPVNLDNVFLCNGKSSFPRGCKNLQTVGIDRARLEQLEDDTLGLGRLGGTVTNRSEDGQFRLGPGEHWPFERRGDLYLVLTREPLLFLGFGLDLYHATEGLRCHVEDNGDRNRLLYYFRPGSPPYPPHGAVYDNGATLRVLGVLWTEDGLNWHRQFILGPDEFDRIGKQFYGMSFIHPSGTDGEGRPVMSKRTAQAQLAFGKRNLYLCTMTVHRGIEQVHAVELFWTRDLLHFHRFTDHRRCLLEPGQGGEYDCGQIRSIGQYSQFNDEWWLWYTGVNTRHNGYGIMARYENLAQLKEDYPNHAEAAYFSTWEGYYEDGKRTAYLTCLGKCKAFRLAHAEPEDVEGTLITRKLRVDGDTLQINAATEPGGQVRVQLLDEAGDGLLEKETIFKGDDLAFCVADLSSWKGRTLCIRFSLRRARLYAFAIVDSEVTGPRS